MLEIEKKQTEEKNKTDSDRLQSFLLSLSLSFCPLRCPLLHPHKDCNWIEIRKFSRHINPPDPVSHIINQLSASGMFQACCWEKQRTSSPRLSVFLNLMPFPLGPSRLGDFVMITWLFFITCLVGGSHLGAQCKHLPINHSSRPLFNNNQHLTRKPANF